MIFVLNLNVLPVENVAAQPIKRLWSIVIEVFIRYAPFEKDNNVVQALF